MCSHDNKNITQNNLLSFYVKFTRKTYMYKHLEKKKQVQEIFIKKELKSKHPVDVYMRNKPNNN